MFYCPNCKSQILFPLGIELWGSSIFVDNGPMFSISMCEPVDINDGKIFKASGKKPIKYEEVLCLSCKKKYPPNELLMTCRCGEFHPISVMFILMDGNYSAGIRGPCREKKDTDVYVLEVFAKGVKISGSIPE